ncbi:hypothetical protein GCM10020331_045040 [Ectobacillus funiculus]
MDGKGLKKVSQATQVHEQSTVNDIPQTTWKQDMVALLKMGIVNSNALTTFTGFWLALHYNGLSFFCMSSIKWCLHYLARRLLLQVPAV